MPHHRKNKSRGHHVPDKGGADWFRANVRRQRRREEIAIESRRRNRTK